ncbi:asparagine synthase-related protein [Streptomyces xanthophaeus]
MATPGADVALRMDIHLLMPDDPDITMAWGLETGVPFLDQDLVELAAACPLR